MYLRGYKDLGADGFEVMELVSDFSDIMSSPGSGSVLPRHFGALIAGKQIETLMASGLDALYKKSDPNAAAAKFRQDSGAESRTLWRHVAACQGARPGR